MGRGSVARGLFREGKNLKGRLLGLLLGTVGKRVLVGAFDKSVKEIEARNADAKATVPSTR